MSVPSLELDPRIERLPLITLYLTERCNSRCVTCDYWRHGRIDLDLDRVTRLIPSLRGLQTEVALISGGEPLLHRQWAEIAASLRDAGLKLWLLSSGLSLAKHARRVSRLFDAVTVSMDGTDATTYAAIRGLDAFEQVCAGVRAAARLAVPVSLRVTLQRANFRQLPAFVDLAAELGARQISFLAVDVANPHAFGRSDDYVTDLALRANEITELDSVLSALEHSHATAFASGFIAESPGKLRRIRDYFAAVGGTGEFPTVRCNAPQFSAVLDATGRVHPCFFIAGAPSAAAPDEFAGALNEDPMRSLRHTIRTGQRSECTRCVCSLWRDPAARWNGKPLLERTARA